jgi:hypothetical protein
MKYRWPNLELNRGRAKCIVCLGFGEKTERLEFADRVVHFGLDSVFFPCDEARDLHFLL